MERVILVIKNIICGFEKTVLNNPNKIAVIHNDKELSFSELRARSIYLANHLVKKSVKQSNRPICVFLPKGIEVVICDIAIMYTCNIFNNLDIKTPANRILNILNTLRPQVVITDSKYKNQLANITPDIEIYALDVDNYDVDNYKEDAELVSVDILTRLQKQVDTDPYCIINTSGSTGTPKGVVLTHKGFINYVNWASTTFNFDGNEILGVMSSIVFDHYVYETTLMMLKGSTLVLLDMIMAAFPVKLLAEIQNKKVNYIFWVPTVMVNIANMGLLDRFELPNLKMIWFAGEVFPTKQFNVWKNHFPKATFVNLYGPCEITVDCTYYKVDREFKDEEPLPIGVPCQNTDVFLLDEEDNICRQGDIGEICVRGTGVALGYYNNKERTELSFTMNPLNKSYPERIYRTGDLGYFDDNGLLMFKGRRDSLIKHMGNRVELGEIEHIIVNKLCLAKNACAVYDYDKKEIVLFYEENANADEKHLKLALTREFPRYMIPARYILMDELPRNPNGKIDRLRLKQWVLDEN